MLRRRPPRGWPHQTFARPAARRIRPTARHQSSQTSQPSRIDRVTSKLPKWLQKYTNGLRQAPVSHVVSFLILHELTAIVPLFALFSLFHYTTYVPVSYMTDHFGDYVQGGIARFERYFRRKGWFGFGQQEPAADSAEKPDHGGESHTDEVVGKWKSGDLKYEILMEVTLAYAATKALLPIRIVGSV